VNASRKSSGVDYKRHGSRYKARRRAVDVIFEAEQRDVDPVAVVADRIELSRVDDNAVAPVNAYTTVIVEGVAAELDRIDQTISVHLDPTWPLERIANVDRAILRVAVWEMLFNEDVPLKTALVDAVEIASEYSTDDSPKYINAVLDAILNNIDALRESAPEIDVESDDLISPENLEQDDSGLDELLSAEDIEFEEVDEEE
jgi:N utilization substance protein B